MDKYSIAAGLRKFADRIEQGELIPIEFEWEQEPVPKPLEKCKSGFQEYQPGQWELKILGEVRNG